MVSELVSTYLALALVIVGTFFLVLSKQNAFKKFTKTKVKHIYKT
jgi:hypothetical protein